MKNKITAELFRKIWLQHNPNIVHIPSEHELALMEAYAAYMISKQVVKKEISKPAINKSLCGHTFELKRGMFRCSKCKMTLGQWIISERKET
jgi:hypothetical protein